MKGYRVIDIRPVANKKRRWLLHVWQTLQKRTLTFRIATQSEWTGHKIAERDEISFQKSRFYEPGCLGIRFSTADKKEKIALAGVDSSGKKHTAVLEKVVRPKFWTSIILRDEEVKALLEFLTTHNEKWLAPPAPTQHKERIYTHQEIMELENEPS